MELTPYTREHARQAAEVHAEGQAGTFLTSLGLDFLTALYSAMPDSPWVFGSVVLDGDTVAGVGVVALDTDQFFRDVKRRFWPRLLWCVGRQVLRHPSLLGSIVQNIRYPSTLSPRPGEAEVMFLGMRRAYMGRGIGPVLLEHILNEAHRRGCSTATAIIDSRNRAIRWMIAKLPGIHIDREVEFNGRKMLIYRVPLPVSDRAQPPDGWDSEAA